MFIRTKLFLTFLGLCMVPIVLLALINYWSIVRTAEAALQTDQETRLADFTDHVTSTVNEDRNELIKLSRSPPLLEYVRLRDHELPLHSAGTETESLVSRANSSSTIPVELNVRLASVVNTHTHFSSICLFDQP